MTTDMTTDKATVEPGVRRALKAYAAEVGADEASATAWAEQHIADGCDVFLEVLLQHNDSFGTGPDNAYEALKAWATTKLADS